jgi:hypothetical protein
VQFKLKITKAMGVKKRSGQAKRGTLFPEGRGQGVGGRKEKKRKGKRLN